MRMEADRVTLLPSRSYSTGNFIATVGVSASGASKDSVVGPCPVTPEERAAAARKYNMTVADYEPYADNGEG